MTSHRFAPTGHPGVFRQIVGLVPRFRQVVLQVGSGGYQQTPLPEELRRSLAAQGLHVMTLDRKRLRDEGFARWTLAGLARRHGRPLAWVGHLANNGWRALQLAAHDPAPILTIFHGSDAALEMRRPNLEWRFRCLRDAPGSRFAGVSAGIVRDLREWGMPAERSFVQHLGIDLASFEVAQQDARSSGLRIAMAGRLVGFKDPLTGIEAFAAHLRETPESTLHVYGDGPLHEAVRARIRELGIAERVELHGMVPVDVLREELRRAQVALQSSRRDEEGREEGVPNTVLEAMATGLPVVATRHAGIPEAVTHEESGLLAAEGDARGLGDALTRLSRDPELRRRMGAAGRARIERDFDATRQGELLAERILALREHFDALPDDERQRTREIAAPLVRSLADRRRIDRWRIAFRVAANRFVGRIDEQGLRP